MKTKKFIKEIKSMGFHIKDYDVVTVIIDSNEDFIAKVSKMKFGGLATDYPEFYRLEHNTKLRLLDLLIEYAKTPIEDRKEEEKYYYRLKGLKSAVELYLNQGEFSKEFYLNNKDESRRMAKTQFTDAEFEALPEDVKAHNWEKIKVESDK